MGPPKFTVEQLVQKNKDFASSHQYRGSLLKAMGGDIKANGPNLLTISCLDSRTDPTQFLSLQPGTFISLRNVGGRISSFLTDIAALDTLFPVEQVVIIHHSDCGSSYVTDDKLAAQMTKVPEPGDSAERVKREVLVRKNQEGVKADLEILKARTDLREDLRRKAVGLWYDLETGLVEVIE